MCIARTISIILRMQGFDNISYFVKALKIFMNAEIEDSPLRNVNTQIVKDKFLDVCNKCHVNEFLKGDKEVEALLEKCSKVFEQLPIEIGIRLKVSW